MSKQNERTILESALAGKYENARRLFNSLLHERAVSLVEAHRTEIGKRIGVTPLSEAVASKKTVSAEDSFRKAAVQVMKNWDDPELAGEGDEHWAADVDDQDMMNSPEAKKSFHWTKEFLANKSLTFSTPSVKKHLADWYIGLIENRALYERSDKFWKLITTMTNAIAPFLTTADQAKFKSNRDALKAWHDSSEERRAAIEAAGLTGEAEFQAYFRKLPKGTPYKPLAESISDGKTSKVANDIDEGSPAYKQGFKTGTKHIRLILAGHEAPAPKSPFPPSSAQNVNWTQAYFDAHVAALETKVPAVKKALQSESVDESAVDGILTEAPVAKSLGLAGAKPNVATPAAWIQTVPYQRGFKCGAELFASGGKSGAFLKLLKTWRIYENTPDKHKWVAGYHDGYQEAWDTQVIERAIEGEHEDDIDESFGPGPEATQPSKYVTEASDKKDVWKVNDTAYIIKYAGFPDEDGRVVKVDNKARKVWINNLNMPFYGTLANEPFSFDEVSHTPVEPTPKKRKKLTEGAKSVHDIPMNSDDPYDEGLEAGYNDFLKPGSGGGNPYGDKTNQGVKWSHGWWAGHEEAKDESRASGDKKKSLAVRDEGFVVGYDNKTTVKNPYKAGSPNAKLWDSGRQEGIKERRKLQEGVGDGNISKISNDVDENSSPYKQGYKVGLRKMKEILAGREVDAEEVESPFQAGTVQNVNWTQGFFDGYVDAVGAKVPVAAKKMRGKQKVNEDTVNEESWLNSTHTVNKKSPGYLKGFKYGLLIVEKGPNDPTALKLWGDWNWWVNQSYEHPSERTKVEQFSYGMNAGIKSGLAKRAEEATADEPLEEAKSHSLFDAYLLGSTHKKGGAKRKNRYKKGSTKWHVYNSAYFAHKPEQKELSEEDAE